MITIIDYGLGNLGSVSNSLQALGIEARISGNPQDLKAADKLILPGVGAAGEGMRYLVEKGLDTCIREEVGKGKPLLGICLGMQLMLDWSEENDVNCLGLLSGTVKKFKTNLKVPQIGWNQVSLQKPDNPFFTGVPDDSYFYFVHSYYCSLSNTADEAGTTDFDGAFSSIAIKDNLYATQFHPEKSGDVGQILLRNFCTLC